MGMVIENNSKNNVFVIVYMMKTVFSQKLYYFIFFNWKTKKIFNFV